MSDAPTTKVQFPQKLAPLFGPGRYKVMYGGRGGCKSWSAARAALIKGREQPLRILCAREIQDSIKQSVHTLLRDQIAKLGFQDFYNVTEKAVTGANGTEFSFHGLRHNIDNIKSIEGTDICWIEEAQAVSKDSWDKLTPTIRKEGSQIWVVFNPELETDETYIRFVTFPPTNAVLMPISWRDNPWFTPELDQDRLDMKARDPDGYETVWEGKCRAALSGAVYANELRQASLEGRIRKLPYERTKGVHVFADLGWGDNTSLLFNQHFPMETRFLRSYQNQHQLWSHYLKYIQDAGFVIDTIWLPHDADHGAIQGKSIAIQTKEAGFKVKVLPQGGPGIVTTGINAAREIFPRCYFDAEGCADFLSWLKRYVWDENAAGNSTRAPKHDRASHYADAFRTFAMGFNEGSTVQEKAAQATKRINRVQLDLPPGIGGSSFLLN